MGEQARTGGRHGTNPSASGKPPASRETRRRRGCFPRSLRKELLSDRTTMLPMLPMLRSVTRHMPTAILVLGSLGSGVSCAQPAPQAMANAGIDRGRLLAHVDTLASDAYQGRRTGTEGGEMALAYVGSQLRAMDLTPACGEALEQPFSFESRRGDQLSGTNLIARIEGRGSAPGTIVISAHFDHLGTRDGDVFNGADDNASGTAALIEVARALTAAPLEHDVIIAAFDAEEMGLRGARAFVDSACFAAAGVRLNVNMDMVSRSEAGELYASGTFHHPFLKPILEAVPTGSDMTLLFGHDEPGTGRDDWTSSSDHGPFHAKGVPFVYFGVEDHPGYHNPTDDAADITPDFFVAAATYILNAVRAMDASLDSFPE